MASKARQKHLKNIYATNELQLAATCSKMEQVQSEGGRSVSREVVFYNLDAIVGETAAEIVSDVSGCVKRVQALSQ